MSIDTKESLYKQLERNTDRTLLNLLKLVIDELNSTEDTTNLTVETLTATTSITTDVINEQTSAAGVTIDGVLLKDRGIDLVYGYVEQLTSISTPVELNSPSGRITTVSTTLEALSSTNFVLVNSYIKTDSIITVSCYYNGTLITEGIPIIYISPSTPGAINIFLVNAHPTNALNNAVDIAFTIV